MVIAMDINKYYNFDVYANAILGTRYENARVIGVVDYKVAGKYDNIYIKNKNIYPYLPPGTPSDYTTYKYYIINYKGKEIVIAEEWIVISSITQTTVADVTLTLRETTTEQLDLLKTQLRLMGISFDIL